MAIDSIVQNIWSSYEASSLAMKARVSAGIQPIYPFTDFWSQILPANLAYFATLAVLYAFMKNRKTGFNIKPLLVIYNITCVLLAGYVAVGVIYLKYLKPGTFACNPVDTSEWGRQMGWVLWVFYIQKYWEFLDTVFFLLRKSFRQVTFLHVYHHSSVTMFVCTVLLHGFNSDAYLSAILNSTVHVFMYTHYLVSALGYRTPWRRYLTSMQLGQFVLIAVQQMIGLVKGESCGTPNFVNVVLGMYMVTMMILFGNFFVQNYLKKPAKDSVKNFKGHRKNVEANGDRAYETAALQNGKAKAA